MSRLILQLSICTYTGLYLLYLCAEIRFASACSGQLWAVLATLASHTAADPEDSQSDQKNNDNKSTFWEIPYVQFLQFSMTNLKGALTLQCRFAPRLQCQVASGHFDLDLPCFSRLHSPGWPRGTFRVCYGRAAASTPCALVLHGRGAHEAWAWHHRCAAGAVIPVPHCQL